jgi:hypothetical protein
MAVVACGPDVDCGGFYDSTDCADWAERVVSARRAEEPGRRIVHLRFTDGIGGYEVTFSDGTTESEKME